MRIKFWSKNSYLAYEDCIFILLLFLFLVSWFSLFDRVEILLEGDENRYFSQAISIANGGFLNYSYKDFSNGPFYPAVISLLIQLGITDINYIVNVNFVFIFFGSIYCYLIYKNTKNRPQSLNPTLIILSVLFFTLASGNYHNKLLTESLALFLFSGSVYHIKLNSWYTPLFLAALAMTKAIFFYVVIITFAYLLIFGNKRRMSGKFLINYILLMLPWMIYTYSITNRLFYVSNQGEKAIYRLTSLNKDEFGDFISLKKIVLDSSRSDYLIYKKMNELGENHQLVSSTFLSEAFKNIKNDPLKVTSNIISSISRLFFDYPMSYQNESQRGHYFPYLNKFLTKGLFSVGLFLCFILLFFRILSGNFGNQDLFIFIYISISVFFFATMRQLFPVCSILALEIFQWKIKLSHVD